MQKLEGLDARGIVATALAALGREETGGLAERA